MKFPVEFRSDDGRDLTVLWHGGSQVNLYRAGREVNVSSRGEWWSTKPTLSEVREFAHALFNEGSLFYE